MRIFSHALAPYFFLHSLHSLIRRIRLSIPSFFLLFLQRLYNLLVIGFEHSIRSIKTKPCAQTMNTHKTEKNEIFKDILERRQISISYFVTFMKLELK